MKASKKLESDFQAKLIIEIRHKFPGVMIFKGQSSLNQGIPDLLILYGNTWAALECKRSANETPRPNQPWYVETMNHMSFAAFIYPENREEILDEIYEAFRTRG